MYKTLSTFVISFLLVGYVSGQCTEGNCQNGKGTMVYPSGAEYTGSFKNGKQDGQGILIYSNKNKYVGNWENHRRHGKGRMIFTNGDVYFGAFQENKMTGIGEMTYQNGDLYTGNWLDGQPSGEGTLVTTDGNSYTGNFENGMFNGYGEMKYADKNIYRGNWENGLRHGKGIFITKDGDIVEEEWLEDRLASEIFGYDPNNGNSKWTNANLLVKPTVLQSEEVKIWAVIVGVSSYEHMPALRYTDDDAYQLYAFLKSPEGGALPDNQIRVLIDERATQNNILYQTQSVLLQADENDVILFYFSGHGLESSFLPVDYDGVGNQLRHEEIKMVMEQSVAKHKIVIADACHSGGYKGIRSTSVVEASLQRYYKAFEDSKGGTALLLSSKEKEYSLEDGGFRSGVFSHFVIQGLKGKADQNKDKIVSVIELFKFANENVRHYTGGMQTPLLTGDFDPEMPLAVIR